MKIAILGTRGIPNQYGGFEQISEYLSVGLVEKKHEVFVYNPHNHSYQEKAWNGVQIIHCYDPEYKLGTAGQFIYDLNCVLDARKRGFDLLLFLGYTSSSVWGMIYPKKPVIVSNMDGLEWKRSKYSKPVQKFLEFAEKLAVKYSDFLIADSLGIKEYLQEKYSVSSTYIAYGANVFENADSSVIIPYGLEPNAYYMIMARMEPENNIEMVLDGYSTSQSTSPFIVIGNAANKFGTYLKNKFAANGNIKFLGAIYNQDHINNLRYFSKLYFHGHSVGGTNPSLLEAMASKTLIAAHENVFNQSILGSNAFYFSDSADIKKIIDADHQDVREGFTLSNIQNIVTNFAWTKIITQYENYLTECYQKNKR